MSHLEASRADKSGCSILHFILDDKSHADALWRDYQVEASSSALPLFQRRAMAVVGQIVKLGDSP